MRPAPCWPTFLARTTLPLHRRPRALSVPDRTYTSFSQASTEASNSRLYGGIHWSFDNEDGLAGGQALGQLRFCRDATSSRFLSLPAATYCFLL